MLAIEYKYGVRTEWLHGKGEKYTSKKTLDKTEEELIKALRENPEFKEIVLDIKKLIP